MTLGRTARTSSPRTPSHPIEFDLLPGQWLVGASEVGLADVSVLVEYQEGE